MSMNENVDILVCHPDVGINKTLEAVFIQFEVMNPDTQEGLGKSHTVMMTMPDAMRLLRHLEHIQQKFSLPNPTIEIAMTEIPASKKKSWSYHRPATPRHLWRAVVYVRPRFTYGAGPMPTQRRSKSPDKHRARKDTQRKNINRITEQLNEDLAAKLGLSVEELKKVTLAAKPAR
jgi:hypothetical protein